MEYKTTILRDFGQFFIISRLSAKWIRQAGNGVMNDNSSIPSHVRCENATNFCPPIKHVYPLMWTHAKSTLR